MSNSPITPVQREPSTLQNAAPLQPRRMLQLPRIFRNFAAMAAVYCLALTIAEVLTTYVSVMAGAIVHFVLLLVLTVHAALGSDEPGYEILIGLILLPIIRLLSISMPLYLFDQVYWYLIISIPIFIAVWAAMRILGYNRKRIGFQWRWKDFPFHLLIIVISVPFSLVEYVILQPDPLFKVVTPGNFVIGVIALFVGTGLVEEVIFRGILQQTSTKSLGKWRGILFSAVAFSIMHIGWQSIYDIAFVFIAGIIWGYAFDRSKSIVSVVVSHTLTNTLLFIVFPLILSSTILSSGFTVTSSSESPDTAASADATPQTSQPVIPTDNNGSVFGIVPEHTLSVTDIVIIVVIVVYIGFLGLFLMNTGPLKNRGSTMTKKRTKEVAAAEVSKKTSRHGP